MTSPDPSVMDDGPGPAAESTAHRRLRTMWAIAAALSGPGLVVMLADTDAGSIITAAQSGARWGYTMILPQLLLVPVLYVVQEMTIRLGVLTGAGHGMLIRERFGRGWALLSAGTLFASAIGALITEFAAVAGVGELFGVSRWVSVPVATAFLVGIAFSGRYRRVERIGIGLGLAEVAFVVAMVMSHPAAPALLHGMTAMPLGNHSYLYLLAANVGAVIMPWMIFYQQGAVIDKGLRPAGIRRERAVTAVGAVLTQVVMIAVVVTLAATVRRGHPGLSLGTVGQISTALRPFLGTAGARVVFGAGMLGAALVAALVASLAGAWGLAEIFGWSHTLDRPPGRRTGSAGRRTGSAGRRDVTVQCGGGASGRVGRGRVSRARVSSGRAGSGSGKFYLTYGLAHVAGAVLVLASVDLIGLALDVEVMNALLLPIVLGFLVALEARALPPEQRMRGWRRYTTWALCLAVSVFGLYLLGSAVHL